MKLQTTIDFIIDHKTQKLIQKGAMGDLVVNQLGTFIVCMNEETKGAVLKCLYPIISE